MAARLASAPPRRPSVAPDHLNFHISNDNDTGSDGGFNDFFYNIKGTDPDLDGVFTGSTGGEAGWTSKPGNYWWQVVEPGCTPAPDPTPVSCVSVPRSLTITPLPASVVTKAQQVETFLGKRPRHRTRKRKVKFSFSSNVTGATFECLFAKGWADCRSPHVFRHLRRGRYKFEVRAVVNGIEDPDPQIWYFRVLRHRHHHRHQ